MKLEQTLHSTQFSPCEDACDDTPVSHRYHPNNTLRIILADDHPVVLMGAEMALGTHFSIVAQTHDADELIDRLQSTPCDLLISDYSMPYGRFPDGLAWVT
jgi:two-component system capsular synthesis response regulator RcsB